MKLRSASSKSVSRQRGGSLLGVFLIIGVLALAGVMVARVAPSVLEFKAVQAAVDKAKQGNTPDQVRQIFDRTAEVDGITSIRGSDLDITKDETSGGLKVNFAYDREFRLGGPAYLVLKYAGKSS